ncbi:ser/thr kinase [Thraustotheca clavata]|uniref:Ser/thr kinase n=1 Tax=Thraustotheca clavata TaxID=74557 RepID=A0A1V9YUZ9_9STRA|nr:ser/thr kinase [Thraustotheca clavata]
MTHGTKHVDVFTTPLPKRIHVAHPPLKPLFGDLSPVMVASNSPELKTPQLNITPIGELTIPSPKQEAPIRMNLSSQFDDISDDSDTDGETTVATIADVSQYSLDTSAAELVDEVLSESNVKPRISSRKALNRSSRCPPTPMRNPPWAKRPNGTPKKNTLVRQSSLSTTKLLVSLENYPSKAKKSNPNSYFDAFSDVHWIGAGAFSDVYQVKAHDGKQYAVKKSKLPLRSRRERERSLQEIKLYGLLSVSGPSNLLEYYQSWQEQGYFYLQTELCTGGTLKDWMESRAKEEAIEEDSLWMILRDVASGLKILHEHQIVHLDIKPANLFISMNGIVKIGDLGTAMEVGDDGEGQEGDRAYMALELLDSPRRATSADIFSLALTMIELIQKDPLPQDGKAWHDLRHDKLPDLNFSEALTNLLGQMISIESTQRPTAAQILQHPNIVLLENKTNTQLTKYVKSQEKESKLMLDTKPST